MIQVSKMIIINNLKEDLERINKNIKMYESKIAKVFKYKILDCFRNFYNCFS